MAKLVPENHPALHQIAEEVPVEEISSSKVQKVLRDMRAALKEYNVQGFVAVAIAAPQIGVPLRIFLVHDMSEDRDPKETVPDIVAINPTITKLSRRKQTVGEGCLSVPEKYGAVKRAARCTLRALDENGEEFERGAGGLLAQIFQHECDHLDGVLFVDRAEKVWTKDEMDSESIPRENT